MTRSWDDLRQEFRMVVLRRGPVTVAEMAERMNVGRSTVFDLMQGKHTPRTATRACIERFVNEQGQSEFGLPETDPA